jgi:hypothetical protein
MLLIRGRHTAVEHCQSCQGKVAVYQLVYALQFAEDQMLPAHSRRWLLCEIDEDGNEVLILLATPAMLQSAIHRGIGEPIYLDATHGMQQYGLKVATGHIKTVQGKGAILVVLCV